MFFTERIVLKKIFILIALTILFTSGCEEIELVGFPGNAEEIKRYIDDDDLGHDFFRTDNIILSTPYVYPLDTGAIYFDNLISTERHINPFVETYDSTKDLLYAHVVVNDDFTYTTTRVKGTDTAVFNRSYRFIRKAYFEQLGDQGQRFSGWLLTGFNGKSVYPGSYVGLFHANNSSFYDDINYYLGMPLPNSAKYLALTGSDSVVERLSDGEILKARMSPYSESFIQILSTETQNGFIYQQFMPDSLMNSTIQFTTPSNRHQTWGIIVFKEYLRATGDSSLVPAFNDLGERMWCEPFRVD